MPFDFSPTETKTDAVADMLRRAKALIDTPEKWGKGDGGRDPLRGHCVITAIMAVRENHEGVTEAKSRFARANKIDGYIGAWNDDETRTHAEVMSAFDRAIELAERA